MHFKIILTSQPLEHSSCTIGKRFFLLQTINVDMSSGWIQKNEAEGHAFGERRWRGL